MLEGFKKFLKADTPAEELIQEETEVAAAEVVDAVSSEVVASLSASLEKLQSQFDELQTKYTALTSEMAEIEEQKASMVAKAAEDKLAKRKEALEAAVGSVKAEALLLSLNVLDDTQFSAVVTNMTVNLDEEKKSSMFTESGVTAEASEVKPAHFKDYIKTK